MCLQFLVICGLLWWFSQRPVTWCLLLLIRTIARIFRKKDRAGDNDDGNTDDTATQNRGEDGKSTEPEQPSAQTMAGAEAKGTVNQFRQGTHATDEGRVEPLILLRQPRSGYRTPAFFVDRSSRCLRPSHSGRWTQETMPTEKATPVSDAMQGPSVEPARNLAQAFEAAAVEATVPPTSVPRAVEAQPTATELSPWSCPPALPRRLLQHPSSTRPARSSPGAGLFTKSRVTKPQCVRSRRRSPVRDPSQRVSLMVMDLTHCFSRLSLGKPGPPAPWGGIQASRRDGQAVAFFVAVDVGTPATSVRYGFRVPAAAPQILPAPATAPATAPDVLMGEAPVQPQPSLPVVAHPPPPPQPPVQPPPQVAPQPQSLPQAAAPHPAPAPAPVLPPVAPPVAPPAPAQPLQAQPAVPPQAQPVPAAVGSDEWIEEQQKAVRRENWQKAVNYLRYMRDSERKQDVRMWARLVQNLGKNILEHRLLPYETRPSDEQLLKMFQYGRMCEFIHEFFEWTEETNGDAAEHVKTLRPYLDPIKPQLVDLAAYFDELAVKLPDRKLKFFVFKTHAHRMYQAVHVFSPDQL